MAKTTDEAVMELLKKVQQKKDEIEAAKKKPHWKTNCTIGYDPDSTSGRINIMTVRVHDVQKIIDLYSFLSAKQEYSWKAIAALGLKMDAITYMGYPIQDWLDDLKTRAVQLSIDQKKKEMDELDERVNNLVSPDQRREMELKALQDILR